MSFVLLVESYFTGSHRAWAEGYAAHSSRAIHLVTHPGRHWRWRMQGAALTLAAEIDGHVAKYGRPDVLLVSDMVHMPALLGLARRSLAGVPVAVYFHENQLTYPLPDDGRVDHTYAMTNWLSMAAADLVIFNSEYHRRDLAAALPAFLAAFPDLPHSDSLDEVMGRSTVLPVGVDVPRFTDVRSADARHAGRAPASSGGPPVVLWNHRWEYDKDPDAFAAALHALADRGVDFRLSILGRNSDRPPPAFAQLRDRFGDRVVASALRRRMTIQAGCGRPTWWSAPQATSSSAWLLPRPWRPALCLCSLPGSATPNWCRHRSPATSTTVTTTSSTGSDGH
jgi:glycosyltransferase involved in cell wall biosynthesis